ncbi:MarR family transcriptional regulator [Petroclostridium sp. X23]|uniref:MarR family winged helix-turn-helix transcriptional regulator n=1 Tax=Petroclostridium sp. X23 TaxID=3045146 RepID=UPI0024AE5EFA|nr:MarR family transcriptional regulator [Petroclostridium sp. X23]WHH57885.1 MarR family transcriptional regulator [Petroclostridium sp. X23]
MDRNNNETAQRLVECFSRFHRINWHQKPIVGLKHSEIRVLFCIKKEVGTDATGIKISEISNTLRVTSPTVTQLVNGLESNGFVERSIDPEDRRVVQIRLTEKGEDVIKKASDAFHASLNGLVEYLGQEKSAALIELLSEVFVYFNEIKK